MPLYEYECTACHKHTEKIQKFSDPEITTCPYCGGTLQRVITAPAIAFKGGGWYADGYGNAKPAGSSESKSGGESKAGGDSKPEATAPTTSESKSSATAESSAKPVAAPAPAAPASPSASEKK